MRGCKWPWGLGSHPSSPSSEILKDQLSLYFLHSHDATDTEGENTVALRTEATTDTGICARPTGMGEGLLPQYCNDHPNSSAELGERT